MFLKKASPYKLLVLIHSIKLYFNVILRFMMKSFFCIFLLIFIISSCDEPTYTPKPRGYFQLTFPEKKYHLFQEKNYPYSFEYPTYARIEKDSLFFEKKAENPWWINITFPTLGGKLFFSYKEINQKENKLSKLLNDSHTMSYYHTKRADYINDPVFHTANNVHGVLYDVGGNAASSYQFFATDSHTHFIRCALYFDVTPNKDSLKPATDFLKQDIEHLIQTLKWTR